jgi:hypothetical protein
VDVWLGVVFFGVGNFTLLFFLLDVYPISIMWGLGYALLVAGFAALLYFVARLRGFAVGIVAGFVLMTLVSGGACTLFTDDPYFGLEGEAIVLYPLAVVIGGIAVAVHAVIQGVRSRRGRRS